MIILKVLIVLLALLLLVLPLRVGADVGYDEGGVRVMLRVSRWTYCLFPREQTKPKKQRKPKEKKKQGKPDITKEEILDAVDVLVRSVKKLRFRLYRLRVHFISAFGDPYRTAMMYGYANAAVQALGLPEMKQADVQLAVDFERESYYVDGYISVTVRVFYVMKLCVCLAAGLLPILLRRRKRMKAIVKNTAVKGKVA